MKKLIKFISIFIPNKKLRHKFREKYVQYILQKELNYIESEKGKKELEKIEKEFPKVLSITETVNEIINNKKSLCRFGDGEFNLLLKDKKASNIFQNKSEKLKNRLIEVLNSKNKNILVCISPFKSNKEYVNKNIENKFPKFMERYWLAKWRYIKPILNSCKNYSYGNSLISRVNMFYELSLDEIKKIWGGKNVVFVYSKKGRFIKDKRLFNNIKSVEEIFIPAIDAFSEYENILNKCLEKDKNSLFLIAAGATATILAYDLSLKGYQALDIGHLPNCYQEFLGEIDSPEFLPREKKD